MLVDSKQELLSIPEIMDAAIDEQKIPQDQISASKLAVVQEGSMPDADVRQFGNTVFISHFKEKDGKKVVFGRPINADVGKNFLENVEDYVMFLTDQGVGYFISGFKDPKMKTVISHLERPDTQRRMGTKVTAKLTPTKSQTAVFLKFEAM